MISLKEIYENVMAPFGNMMLEARHNGNITIYRTAVIRSLPSSILVRDPQRVPHKKAGGAKGTLIKTLTVPAEVFVIPGCVVPPNKVEVELYDNGLMTTSIDVKMLSPEQLAYVRGIFNNVAKGMKMPVNILDVDLKHEEDMSNLKAVVLTENVKKACNILYGLSGEVQTTDSGIVDEKSILDVLRRMPGDVFQKEINTVKSFLNEDENGGLDYDEIQAIVDDFQWISGITFQEIETVNQIGSVLKILFDSNVDLFSKRYWKDQANRIGDACQNTKLFEYVLEECDNIVKQSNKLTPMPIQFVPTVLDAVTLFIASGEDMIPRIPLLEMNKCDEDSTLCEDASTSIAAPTITVTTAASNKVAPPFTYSGASSFETYLQSLNVHQLWDYVKHMNHKGSPNIPMSEYKANLWTWCDKHGIGDTCLYKFWKNNGRDTEINVITSTGIMFIFDTHDGKLITTYALTPDEFLFVIDFRTMRDLTLGPYAPKYSVTANEISIQDVLIPMYQNIWRSGSSGELNCQMDASSKKSLTHMPRSNTRRWIH